MDIEKARRIAQTEIAHHRVEEKRLIAVIDNLMTDLEYHQRQIRTWETELGSLAVRNVRELPDPADGFVERRLTLIQGGGGDSPEPVA